MLKTEKLTKEFGELKAVDNLNLEIKEGELFSVIGPNGSGKTTIIKMISGLLRPTGGSVSVGGDDVVRNSRSAKAKIGYIPDEPRIWQAITGEEFLHFSGAFYNMPPADRIEKINTYLNIFGLNGIEKNYFENYSRGNKQKFSIIAALIHEPKLLLIDEPITGLDPDSADIAKNLFKEFANNGGAVLMATHTLSVAEEISSRVGVLKEGVLLDEGSINDLRRKAGLGEDGSLHDIYKNLAGTKNGS
ncbi:MAG: ABC transporter ATP-binding protein [Candidatus Spechtbacterales bacterium]|nr:ABC transporter ATP-binding protein [Candidatus Spechtbacterales bacterium]